MSGTTTETITYLERDNTRLTEQRDDLLRMLERAESQLGKVEKAGESHIAHILELERVALRAKAQLGKAQTAIATAKLEAKDAAKYCKRSGFHTITPMFGEIVKALNLVSLEEHE